MIGEKPKFWAGPGGAMLCSVKIDGIQELDLFSASYYGGTYFVGETISEKMARKIAAALGGEYLEKRSESDGPRKAYREDHDPRGT